MILADHFNDKECSCDFDRHILSKYNEIYDTHVHASFVIITAKCNACAAGQTLEQYCLEQQEYVEGCFEFTVSLVYTANTTCKEQAPADSGFWWPEQTLRKPVGACTKNVIGNTVIFECDQEKGIIMEHVYHDVLDGSVCKGAQCSCDSEIIYTLTIENGCSEQFFGGMHMTWNNFCQEPKESGKFHNRHF